ncbi:hypothetical protein Prudu_011982 [Prunus dulcis]|uniref:Uncharacterized protein n=1 Tax=Prunus dulcis TaxID=3755 RepID=A0A4Y1RBN8_PRUDU|nr:hypothetical protein Prudu_011982 [Prunus dulcis]
MSWLRIFGRPKAIYGRLCRNFGRKSQSLVSGPGIGVMSGISKKRDRIASVTLHFHLYDEIIHGWAIKYPAHPFSKHQTYPCSSICPTLSRFSFNPGRYITSLMYFLPFAVSILSEPIPATLTSAPVGICTLPATLFSHQPIRTLIELNQLRELRMSTPRSIFLHRTTPSFWMIKPDSDTIFGEKREENVREADEIQGCSAIRVVEGTFSFHRWLGYHLHLPSKGLKGGMFPSSFGNLTHLTHLNLSKNSLYGSLQTEFFSSLKHLEILDLSYNLLSRELPLYLPSSSIKKLDLSSNQFQGAIPSSFFQQTRNLISFNVSKQYFIRALPILYFISQGLGECSELRVFCASHNNLSGFLPEDIYNATKLEELALALNSLYGAISDRIVNLTNLAILDLYYNQLSGVLPLNFGKLSKCLAPPSLMNCTNLIEIHLASNNLEGDISTLNFSKLSELSKIDLMINEFIGILPISLYSCRSLKAIRLSGNCIEGQIQAEILSLKSLSFLSLGFDRLTNVTDPMKILMSCTSLPYSSLRIPLKLTGQIPVWLSKLKNLEILHLENNQITGPIPSWLGTLPILFFSELGR